jgi:hypothetical protein
MPEQTNDHDSLVTLVANVNSLKESQELFHKEMKESFRDLKDNYSGQLNAHENRISTLEKSRINQNTMMAIGTAILTLLVSLMVYHIMH